MMRLAHACGRRTLTLESASRLLADVYPLKSAANAQGNPRSAGGNAKRS